MSAPAPVVYRMRLKPAAAAHGVGYDSLQQACKNGEIPDVDGKPGAIQPFGAWLVLPEAVEMWMQQRDRERVEST